MNTITKQKDDSGQWQDWNSGVQEIIYQYFSNIFVSQGCDCDAILRHVQLKISDAQNQLLMEPFSAEDIKAALFFMYPEKVPGPDGFNPGFFQKH